MTSCGGTVLEPYFLPIRPATAEATGPVKPVTRGPQPVSICYSSATTTPQRVQELVNANCEGAVLVSNRTDLAVCSLMQPIRAVYQCQRISSTLAEQRPIQRPTLSR